MPNCLCNNDWAKEYNEQHDPRDLRYDPQWNRDNNPLFLHGGMESSVLPGLERASSSLLGVAGALEANSHRTGVCGFPNSRRGSLGGCRGGAVGVWRCKTIHPFMHYVRRAAPLHLISAFCAVFKPPQTH